ncbi:MAG TPA: phosphoethanolamine--lipid A transferase [Burkholderiales bacterium]|nr:phosphoethanolamine--lipid A transferase [Burkholderiales bacterium]
MTLPRLPRRGLTANTLIVVVAVFLTAFGNGAFISNLLKTYALDGSTAVPLLSLIVVFGGTTIVLLAALCIWRATKPVLIFFLLLSSLAAYFMDSYGVVISDEMLHNAALTNVAEVRDLLNVKLLAYFVVLGLVPAVLVARLPLRWRGLRSELLARLKLLGFTLATMAGVVLAFGSFYASFFREHKVLRAYANPTYYSYAAIQYLRQRLTPEVDTALAPVGRDAKIPATDPHRELIIMVLGETARADRFSLNGYARDTNPQLREAGAISLTNVWACGTSTAVSVPCMFALDGESGSAARGTGRENLLDVLQHAGVNVLWRDNNSDSKGVALRVPYEDYRSPKLYPVCDLECRDEGMLGDLQRYIDAHPSGDIFIVLHQMGNHGPAYYRRYPAAFERFKPACRDDDLSRCSRDEIDNAYDNAILYTDHFLAQTIALLERNDAHFETALFYVSDHGESLGEGGLYLHGMPKLIAPDTQVRVPVVLWFGKNFDDVDLPALQKKRDVRFTHANIFHTVLGFLEIETSVYQAGLDILQDARPPHEHMATRSTAR